MKTVYADERIEALFLVPPARLNKAGLGVDRLYGCNYGFDSKPPLHLLQSATALRDSGYNVRLLDCPAEGYGLSDLVDFIARQGSLRLVVFFTVWLSAAEDLAAAGIISRLRRDTRVVFTGAYPTWKPGLFLKNGNYFVVRGEPEAALIELAKAFKGSAGFDGIRNVSFSGNSGARHNPWRELVNLDSLPVPDRRLLKGRYSFNRLNRSPATAACFSRGCVFKCAYCAPQAVDQAIELENLKHSAEKPPLRLRGVEKVIRELRDIRELGYKAVEICDNQFVWDRKRTAAICAGIRDLGLEWICCARPDHLTDKDTLKAMAQAGCRLIYMGTESFDQRILDDIGKQLKAEDSRRAVGLLRECGIEPEISVLMGASALETSEGLRRNIREARKLKTRFVHYSVALPLPNTRLYALAKSEGWLRNGEFSPEDNIRGALMDLPHISAERLKSLVRGCYLRQYLSPRFIYGQIFAGGFFQRLRGRLAAFKRLIRYLLIP